MTEAEEQLAGDDDDLPPAPPRQRGFFRRHLALTGLAGIVLLLAVGVLGFLWYLNHQLGSIPRVTAGVTRQAETASIDDSDQALNILVLATERSASGHSAAEDLADGTWTPGRHHSDTFAIVHIPADRTSAQVIAIPAKSQVAIPGSPYGDHDGRATVSAAFSEGGPALEVRTLQQLTGIHIDHVAMVDWSGFRDLTTAVGGVRVYLPEGFDDPQHDVYWPKGWQKLDGKRAVQYVRLRQGPTTDDLPRLQRQQDLTRAVSNSLLSTSTTRSPIRLARVLNALADHVVVDKGWDTGEMRGLALSLRNLRGRDVGYVTLPHGQFEHTPDGARYLPLDYVRCDQLFSDIRQDKVSDYLKQYPEASLPNTATIN